MNEPINDTLCKIEKIISTYSMWSLFQNCRRKYKYRYIDNLVSINKDKNLFFGAVTHECLEIWHRCRDLSNVISHIDTTYNERSRDEKQKHDWHMNNAMMEAYAELYHTENFTIVDLEKQFEGDIINPSTGAISRSFKLAGKVDGIVLKDGDYYLLEHKTAASIDSSYLEKLWTDFQITLYSWYVREVLKIPVIGVIYNILVKVKIKQGMGETEYEYEDRKKKLIAKSKTGKTSAKRKVPESDEDFHKRLAEKYANPEMFHREEILISKDRYKDLQTNLWDLCQSFLEARRKKCFYQNSSFCFNFHKPCTYYPICSSSENQNIIDNFYEKVEPNEELKEKEKETEPVPF